MTSNQGATGPTAAAGAAGMPGVVQSGTYDNPPPSVSSVTENAALTGNIKTATGAKQTTSGTGMTASGTEMKMPTSGDVMHGMSEMERKAGDVASDAAESARSTAASAANKASDLAETGKERAAETYETAKEAAGEAAEATREKASGIAGAMSSMLESARESVVSGIESVKHTLTGEPVPTKEELPDKGIGEAIYETGAAIANKAASMVTPSKSSDTLADQTPGMGELPGTKGPVVPGSEPAPGVAGTYGNEGEVKVMTTTTTTSAIDPTDPKLPVPIV